MAPPERDAAEAAVGVTSDELASSEASADAAINYAQNLLLAMRRRREVFPGLKMIDPAWAILLHLLVQSSLGRRVSVRDACLASGVPPTTALRHLQTLTEQGHMERESDSTDARRTFLRLTERSSVRLIEQLNDEAAATVRAAKLHSLD